MPETAAAGYLPTSAAEPITPKATTHGQIQDLWDRTSQRFVASRNRILFCSRFRRGGEGVEIPAEWETPAIRGALTVQLPQRKLEENRLRAVMAKMRPNIKREPVGPTLRAETDADNLEAWATESAEQTIDWESMVGKGLSDGEYAMRVLCSAVDWEKIPSFMTLIDAGEVEAMEPERAKAVVKGEEPDPATGESTTVYRAPHPKYDRDDKGRAPDEAGYTARSHKKSAEAHADELSDFLRRRLPFSTGVISALDCVPILARGTGRERWRTVGLIVRSLYEQEELLQQGLMWSGQDRLLAPKGFDNRNTYGNGGQVYLYELYYLTAEGHPCISYSVGLQQTSMLMARTDGMRGDDMREVEAKIDLYDEYGLTRLPVRYCWGGHTDEDDPDAYGIPFLDPLAPILINTEGMLTATLVHAWKTAFSGYVTAPNPEAPASAYLEEDQRSLRTIEVPQGGGVAVVPGPVAPLAPPQLGESAKFVVAEMMATWQSETPSDAALGGATPNARTSVVSRDFVLDAQWQVLDGARRAYEWAVELEIEWAEAIRKKFGVRVPVYANFHVPNSEPGAHRRMTKELNERWVGPIYDIKAELPKQPNLAEAQQRADMADRGYATPLEVRELLGDESPIQTLAEIEAWKYYREDPNGKLELAEMTARLQGDAEKADKIKLQREGKMTEGGYPVAAIPPEAMMAAQLAQMQMQQQGGPGQPMIPAGPGGGQPGPMRGMAVPNLAASSMGGQIAGEMMTGPMAQEQRARAQAA